MVVAYGNLLFAFVSHIERLDTTKYISKTIFLSQKTADIQIQLLIDELLKEIEQHIFESKFEITNDKIKQLIELMHLLEDLKIKIKLSRKIPLNETNQFFIKTFSIIVALPIIMLLWKCMFFCFTNQVGNHVYDTHVLMHTAINSTTLNLSLLKQEVKDGVIAIRNNLAVGAERVESGVHIMHNDVHTLFRFLKIYALGSLSLAIFINILMVAKQYI